MKAALLFGLLHTILAIALTARDLSLFPIFTLPAFFIMGFLCASAAFIGLWALTKSRRAIISASASGLLVIAVQTSGLYNELTIAALQVPTLLASGAAIAVALRSSNPKPPDRATPRRRFVLLSVPLVCTIAAIAVVSTSGWAHPKHLTDQELIRNLSAPDMQFHEYTATYLASERPELLGEAAIDQNPAARAVAVRFTAILNVQKTTDYLEQVASSDPDTQRRDAAENALREISEQHQTRGP